MPYRCLMLSICKITSISVILLKHQTYLQELPGHWKGCSQNILYVLKSRVTIRMSTVVRPPIPPCLKKFEKPRKASSFDMELTEVVLSSYYGLIHLTITYTRRFTYVERSIIGSRLFLISFLGLTTNKCFFLARIRRLVFYCAVRQRSPESVGTSRERSGPPFVGRFVSW